MMPPAIAGRFRCDFVVLTGELVLDVVGREVDEAPVAVEVDDDVPVGAGKGA